MSKLISAEDLLLSVRDDPEINAKHFARIKEHIDHAPDVGKHGRWKTANDGTHFCSYCGCDAPYKWDDIDRSFINSADDVPDSPSNHCPTCGARMDGENDG